VNLGYPAGVAGTPEDVRRVAGLNDAPVLRNLLISLGYHDLSTEMRSRTGEGGINWCTLGTWASKTAGRFIRNDEIPSAFRDLLSRGNIFGRLASALDVLHLLDLVERIVGDVSGYIMTGNRVVFAELGQVFADFLALLGGDRTPDPDKLRRFQDTLTDGPPAPDKAEWDAARKEMVVTPMGGQAQLRGMVGSYYQAMFETDPKRRAELLLLGNARGGIHEQTRLQTYIAGSLDAPIADTLLAHAHAKVEDTVPTHTLRHAAHALIDEILPALGRRIEKAWEELATVEMMALTLPDGVIHLGNPVPAAPGMPLIPQSLQTIENPELRGLLQDYDALDVKEESTTLDKVEARFANLLGLGHPVTKALLAAGAHDWVDFNQRMRFILVLFRSRAEDVNLVVEPFSAAQLAVLRDGRVPPGPL
jgi:hypothetical protein